MNSEEFLAMTDILLVGCGELALAESEVVNGIENVGLARSVKSHEAVDFLRKLHVGRLAVLEIRQL